MIRNVVTIYEILRCFGVCITRLDDPVIGAGVRGRRADLEYARKLARRAGYEIPDPTVLECTWDRTIYWIWPETS